VTGCADGAKLGPILELKMTKTSSRIDALASFFPEVRIAGMTGIDGTVRFFTQVNALLQPGMVVLDYGAGRSEWYADDDCAFRRELRTIKGKVGRMLGCDVDPVVLENRSVDEAFVIQPGSPVPLADASLDMILCDNTFEHIDRPEVLAAEFTRLLKPGGWICARTPNKLAYTSAITRLVPNRMHRGVLRHAQPGRKSEDVFPTRFRLNTKRAIRRYFPAEQYDDFTYYALPEPGYHFNRKPLLAAMVLVDHLLPPALTAPLFVFLRKRA
jgi:SAM-dependent methyltransferase